MAKRFKKNCRNDKAWTNFSSNHLKPQMYDSVSFRQTFTDHLARREENKFTRPFSNRESGVPCFIGNDSVVKSRLSDTKEITNNDRG